MGETGIPRQGTIGLCTTCHRAVVAWVHLQSTGIEGEHALIDYGWSHVARSGDEHEAVAR